MSVHGTGMAFYNALFYKAPLKLLCTKICFVMLCVAKGKGCVPRNSIFLSSQSGKVEANNFINPGGSYLNGTRFLSYMFQQVEALWDSARVLHAQPVENP